MNTTNKTNFNLLVDTVNKLASSQGCYSRLARTIGQMDNDELNNFKQYVNSQPQFRDHLDVILFLEQ